MAEVTVLMPVYNGAPFLDCAIKSVLGQSFKDFEFLVIDDASTDGTADIIRRYADPRIRYLRNAQNLGVAGALNRGLEEARCQYIARMDVDDECIPERLDRQVSFMRLHPEVGVLGSWARFMGAHVGAVLRRPCGGAIVRASLCLDNPLTHPTVMIRKAVIDKHNLRYDGKYSRSEDFDLWSRMSESSNLDNLPEVLLRYRIHGDSVTSIARKDMEDQSIDVLRRELARIGLYPSRDEMLFHRAVGHGERLNCRDDLARAEKWLKGVLDANCKASVHPPESMQKAVSFAWWRLCMNCANLGSVVIREYRSSALAKDYTPPVDDVFRAYAAVLCRFLSRVVSRPKGVR